MAVEPPINSVAHGGVHDKTGRIKEVLCEEGSFSYRCYYPISRCNCAMRRADTPAHEHHDQHGSVGLLTALLPPFEKANNCKVDVVSVGTGKALKLGENGDVDVVFVHSRAAEDKFVADGSGVDRRDVMYNDYIIVGPKEDPEKLKEAKTAVDAFETPGRRESGLHLPRG